MTNEWMARIAAQNIASDIRTELDRLTAGLEAALDAHKPFYKPDPKSQDVLDPNGKPDTPMLCLLDHERWPCSTTIKVFAAMRPRP